MLDRRGRVNPPRSLQHFNSATGYALSSVSLGSVSLTSGDGISLNGATVSTVDGGITFLANQDMDTSGAFRGIELVGGSTVTTTGTGDIVLTGRGGDDDGGTFGYGIRLFSASVVQSTSAAADAGTITLTGVGGAATNNNYGVSIEGATVESSVGTISITATGGNSPGAENRGFRVVTGGQVNSTNSASITVVGSSGGGGTIGIQISGGSINTVDGPIMLTGTTDVGAGLVVEGGGQVISTGSDAGATITLIGTSTGSSDGVRISGTTVSLSSVNGDIQITGSSLNEQGVEVSSSASIQTSGTADVTFTSSNAEISPNSSNAVVASAVNFEGILAPGAGTATDRVSVDGDVSFVSGSFSIDLNGLTPETQHDQLQVVGVGRTIDLNGVTLAVRLGGSYTPQGKDVLCIIDNVDSGSAITGTFAGLAEGAVLEADGYFFKVSYLGGDGNDVTLTAEYTTSASINASGDLVLTDVDGVDDALTIVRNGNSLEVTDSGKTLTTSIAGATGHGTSTLSIPLASITGTEVVFDAVEGDDRLTVDFSGGDLGRTLTYNGGSQTTGDTLSLVGSSFASSDSNASNANDGSVTVGSNVINYTGLE